MKTIYLIAFCIFIFTTDVSYSGDILSFEDVMKFEEIRSPVISADGNWIAFGVWPERGDGKARVKHINGEPGYTIERGIRPGITNNGKWAAVIVQPPFVELHGIGEEKPKPGLTLLNTGTGERESFENVERFEFSNNSRWLILHHHRPGEQSNPNKYIGSPLSLIDLKTTFRDTLYFIHESAIDSNGYYFIFSVVDTSGADNGLYFINLSKDPQTQWKIHGAENSYHNNLTWDHNRERIAFTASILDTADNYMPLDAAIITWSITDDTVESIVTPDDIPGGYRLRTNNHLKWTKDGMRLYYGVMSDEMVRLEEEKEKQDTLSTKNLYDIDFILREREVDVWHWDDPLIKPNKRNMWNRLKNHNYTAVYNFDTENSIQLASKDLPFVSRSNNANVVLGRSDLPYRKLITWDGRYYDHYTVDLRTGEMNMVREKLRFSAVLSPGGKYVTFFDNGDWYLYDITEGTTLNLTEDLEIPFENEDNDRPMPSPGYGVAGWTEGDRAVLIYDKYDIWQFDTKTGIALNLTNGRTEERIFRVINLDPDREAFHPREELLLRMYHDRGKNHGFYRVRVGRPGITRLLEDDAKYTFIAKAENSNRILFTKERYDKFPNLWIASDERFRRVKKLTHLYDNLTEQYAWGHAEFIKWLNMDGREVHGILIYPGNYEEGKRYPVVVYFYERFSQRLYDFNHPYTNHRPVFAQYASDGYAVFLPDIWFDLPIPGYSAVKNLVPGVHKLIEMGIADPEAIGLHGHSWSGYLTAYVITQTDIFAAAVAGAPVSNMTSAYGGIRWGTGLARQFQYEMTQSRLGVSLWENRKPYIENSPLFFADRINTPLLIQFGDKDEAVPWEQGIELYLALRRLEKQSFFLQYQGEPHHLTKFANRLDYAIKMKEFFDHYLKDAPAPVWLTEGVPYRGN